MTDQPALQKKSTRLHLSAWLLLPALALLAGAAYVVLGGLPHAERAITSDLIRWLAILPIVSLWWGAMVVSAAAFNLLLTWEPMRGTEAGWADLALTGDEHARWLLLRNDIRWAVLLVISGAFHLLLGARIMAYAGGLGVAG